MTGQLDVILLGFSVPDETIEAVTAESAVLPVQTHKFAWNLVACLRAGRASIRTLSALPVPNFPEYPHMWIPTRHFVHGGVPGVAMAFANVLGAKHLTRAVQAHRWAKRMMQEQPADVMLVHGVHTPFLWQALSVKRRYGSMCCAVLTDLPGLVRPVDGWLSRHLKKVDRQIVKWLLARFDSIIALTPDLASELAPGIPAWITPGFAPAMPNAEISSVGDGDNETRRVAYAGGLSESYGVQNLVRAFRGMGAGDLRLDIYGRGPLEEWLRQQSSQDSRIRFYGAAAPCDLYPRLQTCSVLVNPRTLDDENLRFSFPSKLLEYVALGVPTVTTPLPGITRELGEHVVLADTDSPEALRAAIERALSMDAPAARAFGEAAVGHLRHVWSPTAQGPALVRFLAGRVSN